MRNSTTMTIEIQNEWEHGIWGFGWDCWDYDWILGWMEDALFF